MAPKSKRTEQVASNIGNDASAGPAIKKPNNEEEKPKNEVDKFFDAVETVKNREQYVQGYILVIGLESENDDDDEDEDKVTAENDKQVKTIRLILANDRREKLMDTYGKMLVEDYGTICMMTNTASSYSVIYGIPKALAKMERMKDLKEKFDNMLALTMIIDEFDFWYMDTDVPDACEQSINLLYAAWTNILKHSDADLGIDPEYTRPGIIANLNQFKEKFEEINEDAEIEWTPPQ